MEDTWAIAAAAAPAGAGIGRVWQKLWLGGGIIVFVAMGLQLGLSAWYSTHFYPGVQVAGQNIGNLTREQAQSMLQAKLAKAKVALKVENHQFSATPDQLGVHYDLAATLDQAQSLSLAQGIKGADLGYSFSVDTAKQRAFVNKIVSGTGQAPIDASVVINNGVPQVQPDHDGLALSPSQVESAIDSELAQADSRPWVLQPEVQHATIRSNNTAPAISAAKQLLAVPIALTYQSKVFHPSPADIGSWIAFDKSSSPTPGLSARVDADKIKDYALKLGNQINIAPTNRKVLVENGVSNEQQAGKDGLTVDFDAISQIIAQAVSSHTALSAAIPTKPVPFKTEYTNVVTLDYGRYIEVNLSRQHLWVWQDHNVIFDSPVTSGATGAGFPTAQGLFSIYAKQTNRHLVGYQYGPAYNYDVFVQYWMPFYLGFGLHDASWRSSFGGPDYYYGGSHGCVNLPLSTAAFLYGWADIGTPVWVHS